MKNLTCLSEAALGLLMQLCETEFLTQMARRYCWDAPDTERVPATRVMRRVMDLGVLDDALALERLFGRSRLADVLQTAPPGAFRPRSWWFWHYRLGLADVDHDPPPMPIRRYSDDDAIRLPA